jgi:hypothetical protein
MKSVQRLNKKARIYNKEFCSLYKHDATYTRFCSIESVYGESDKREHIIVGGSGNYYVHRHGFHGPGSYDVQFHDGAISVFVWDGSYGFKGEHPYHKISIESRFTEGGSRCDHYKHMIAHTQPSNDKPLSLANIEFLPDLQSYLKICPTTTSTTTETTPFFAFPVRVVTHHYRPTDTWPLELFERVVKIVKRLVALDNDKRYDVLSKQWSRYEVSNFVQVALLVAGNATLYHSEVLGRRCLMQRCDDATLFCDYAGCLCYKKSHASALVSLPNPIGPVPAPPLYVSTYPVLHDWVTRITTSPVALKDALQYLKDHKKDALKVTPDEFITLFEARAKQHAQRTWDNGTLGAYWEFDADGIRINLYDLQRKQDHLIGTYLVQGRTDGMITHVEYLPDTQPTIYIDGQHVDI